MTPVKVHIIHVGNMNNKGTQTLLKSDIAVLKEVFGGNVGFSVSTTDVEGVKELNLPLETVLPLVVDIPYEKADFFARKLRIERGSLNYKFFALASLVFMFIQALLSVFSVVLVKAGLRGLYRSNVLDRVKKCDLVVSYSDENFKEGASFLPMNVYWILTWWTMLISRTWDVLIAKYYGKPVVMFPNSVGPFKTVVGRVLSTLALNSCSLILVREPFSYRLVESLRVRAPKILTFDTTWLFESDSAVNPPFKDDPSPRVGVSPGVYNYVFSPEEIQKHVVSYAEALDRAVEKFGFSVVFLPHYVSGFRYDDLAISEMILQRMKNKNRAVIVKAEKAEDFKAFLDKMDMVVSSKMHPAVLALSGHVPTLCVAYDHKQTGLFESLDMIKYAIRLNELSGESLFLKICQVWNDKEKIRAVLRERVPSIRSNIRETIRSALSESVEADVSMREPSKSLER
ncbi:MAG: polysaccharide pyruvyl transferase family protein [Candidatus Bathyarchaeia archaeon]